MSLVYALAVATLVQIAHLIEEIKTGFREKFPLGPMPLWILVAVNVLLYAGALVTIVLIARGHSLGTVLARVYGLVLLGNALGHIGLMLIRKRYFPGGITAVLLLPVLAWLGYLLLAG